MCKLPQLIMVGNHLCIILKYIHIYTNTEAQLLFFLIKIKPARIIHPWEYIPKVSSNNIARV